MRTRNMIVMGLLGSALAGATVLQALQAGGPAVPALPVAGGSAVPGGRTVAAEGRVVTYPGAEVQVAAERSGRLTRVLIEEGQRVKKGQVLAEIDADELRASLDAARARVAESEAEIRLAQSSLDRRQKLVEEQILAAHDLDQARRDIEIAGARRETASAEVARLQAQLAKSRVLAPVSGTVTARHADAGESLTSGDPVATIADLGRLRVDAEADEADAAALAVGAVVAVTSEGYPGKAWKGRVEEIADSVTIRKLKPQDPGRPTDTRVLAVKVAFAEPSPLKLGTTVELRIGASGR